MPDFLKLDYPQIALNVAGAFAAMTVLAILGVNPFVGAIAVTVVGVGLEAWRSYKADGALNPMSWSIQQWVEAASFPVTAILMALQ